MHPAWLEIDLGAIEDNVRAIVRAVGPRCAVMAVVKANGYGHGLVESALAAVRGGASWLCVARVEEGSRLREEGVDAPILVSGGTLPSEAQDLVRYGLDATVYSRQQVGALSRAAERLGLEAGIQIKVDTGMGRLGVTPAELPGLTQACQKAPGVRLHGVWSHLATADHQDDRYAKMQFRQFKAALRAVHWKPSSGLAHISSSAAIVRFREMHLSAVRPGLLIYGLRPATTATVSIECRPALSLKARVVMIKTRPAGTPLSYGCAYVTERRTRVATLPVGYGDGYKRSLGNQAQVLLRGRRAPIVGRVCMDHLLVDVTDVPGVAVGEEAVLIGRQGKATISACEVAGWGGTIVNEIVCALTSRLPRTYWRQA